MIQSGLKGIWKVSPSPSKGLLSTFSSLAKTLSGEYYTKPEHYEQERKAILSQNWQVITHESVLLQNCQHHPSTFVTETLSGWPCIVARSSKTGEIYGYHNACRHRAGPLEYDGQSGGCKLHGLTCKYHGWNYSLEGQLKGTPKFCSKDGDFDKSKFHLWPLRVAVWRGLVFVQTQPTNDTLPMHGAEATKLFVKENQGFCNKMQEVPLEDFKFHAHVVHPLKCNWKVYVENYLEGYHIPAVHKELNSQIVMDKYEVLLRDGYIEHSVTPAEGTTSAYKGLWVFLPCTTAINYYNEGLSVERIVPTGPNTTEIRYIYLFHKDASKESIEHAINTSRSVTKEDIDICEAVQKGLEGGSYHQGILSPRHEQGVRHFQNLIRKGHSLPLE